MPNRSTSQRERHAYLFPLVIAVAVSVAGWWAHGTIRDEMQAKLRQELRAILGADLGALDVWMSDRVRAAELAVQDPELQKAIWTLADAADVGTDEKRAASLLRRAPEQLVVARHARRMEEHLGFRGFVVINRDGLVLASSGRRFVGVRVRRERFPELWKVLEAGESHLVVPQQQSRQAERRRRRRAGTRRREGGRTRRESPERTDAGGRRPGGPPRRAQGDDDEDLRRELSVMIATPVTDAAGEVIAAVGHRLPSGEDFTRILSIARFGETGETFAFNGDGVMITKSRFDEQLKRVGLLPNTPSASSVLAVQLRDPGVDITRGFTPEVGPDERPWTRPTAAALSGRSGVDVEGFADYRGVPAVGAWRWLPEHQIGVTTKVDVAEAFRPLTVLQRTFAVLTGLLVVLTAGVVGYSLTTMSLARRVREAESEARRLGQYRLERKIGEGGMGVVYRASHALLRRPTAIKLIAPTRSREDPDVAQFEREVQLTSQLTHPNTIQIYDYGQTEDGVFYYAMEYLDGISLQELVEQHGPPPVGRVISFLTQICGSLSEAHAAGLIHRDIKPSNVIITARGGRPDWVKVLDFGLVTQVGGESDRPNGPYVVAGTPAYMAPEAFSAPETVDARSDIYALGGVAYFLLTAADPFEGMTAAEIRSTCMSEDNTLFDSPKAHLDADNDLHRFALACLSRDPSNRPQDMDAMRNALRMCADAGTWTEGDARTWWETRSCTTSEVPLAREDETTRLPDATVRIELSGRVGDRLRDSLSA